MNKWWIAAPIVAAVAAGVPFVTAPQAEHAFTAGVDELNDYLVKNGIPLKLTSMKYEKGTLASTSVQRLEFFDPTGLDGMESPVCIDLETELDHGYTALLGGSWVSAKTTIVNPLKQTECGIAEAFTDQPELATAYIDQFGNKGPLVIESKFGLAGTSEIEMILKALDFKHNEDGEAVKIKSSELTGIFELNSGRDEVDIQMDWPGLEVEASEGAGQNISFNLDGMTLNADQKLLHQYLWVGPYEQKFGKWDLRIKDAEKDIQFSVDSTSFVGDSEVASDMLNSDAVIAVNGIAYGKESLGDFELNLSFDDFPAEQTDQIVGFFTKLTNGALKGEGQEPNEAELQAFGEKAKQVMEKAKLKLNALQYGIGDEKVKFDGQVYLKDVDKLTIEQIDQDGKKLIKHIYAKLDGKLDEKLISTVANIAAKIQGELAGVPEENREMMASMMVTQASAALQNFQNMGFVVHDADAKQYKTEFSFENGQATINSQIIPLPIPN